MVINTNDASNVELSSTPHRQGLFIYNEYGNTDHRVSSPGIQNQSDFCLKINILPQSTQSLCSQKMQCSSKQLRFGFVLCSKCPALFQNSIAAKKSATRVQFKCPALFLQQHYFENFPPVMLFFLLYNRHVFCKARNMCKIFSLFPSKKPVTR